MNLRAPVLLDEIAAVNGAEPARRLIEVRNEIADLREQQKALTDPGRRSSAERVALTRKIADLSEFAKGIEALLREVRNQVIRDARLITCTTHQVLLQELHLKHFDVVVIDEASMVSGAEGDAHCRRRYRAHCDRR
jgi:superfamily I DNA and/or RNA helicase